MEPADENVTTVTIFNQTFRVRSGGDPEYVEELAELVDQRMSALAEQTLTVDTLKIAILAALNIADDYLATRNQLEELKGQLTESSDRIVEMLAAPLRDLATS